MRLILLLSLVAGAVMFALLFYMPLLLQGVYGYAPREAGLLITPLMLCITLGAIFNGRVVARVRNPQWLPRLGFFLLLLTFIGLLQASARQVSFTQMLVLMFAGGSGLGLTLMNLTLFSQVLAPREHLGIVTALVQALRLVGGMLGTALVGSLVSLSYRNDATGQLAALHLPQSLNMALMDPRWMLDDQEQIRLMSGLRQQGVDPGMVIDGLHMALSTAIGYAMVLGAVLAATALYIAFRLPKINVVSRR